MLAKHENSTFSSPSFLFWGAQFGIKDGCYCNIRFKNNNKAKFYQKYLYKKM